MTTKHAMLVTMPFGALERQPLGISGLKAALERDGLGCRNRHLVFEFADFVGVENYQWMASELPYVAFAGDWCFTQSLYGDCPGTEAAYIDEILRGRWHLSAVDIDRILAIRRMVEPFLTHCLDAEPWDQFGLVGFSSTFEQNIASLSLARRLKARFPKMRIVFGGANWEGVMGQELFRQFPCVDYVCSGEADQSFPSLARLALEGTDTAARLATIPGIVYRDDGRVCATGPARSLTRMDDLPVPDYSDYFNDLERSGAAATTLPGLLVETSRGCWWGAKSHCTFCGLNGGAMSFRSKTPQRVLDELDELVGRWPTEQIEFVDNILDMAYFRTLLPRLVERDDGLRFYYETKSNLDRKQVELLSAAGVDRIQPGIESLSDHVLRLMRKGTTALQNIQLLKWCKTYGVTADWNILYGFPGETVDDYREMLALLPAIRFLGRPTACGPIRLDRFSPYFDDPQAFGIVNLRPMASFHYLYPFNERVLRNVAYYFEFDYAAGGDPKRVAGPVIEYVDDWARHPETGTLSSVALPRGGLGLVDTRNQTRRTYRLTGRERAVYQYCDHAHSVSGILRHVRDTCSEEPCSASQLEGFLRSLVENQLMVTDGTSYLSLAITAPPMPDRRSLLNETRRVDTVRPLASASAT